MEIFIETMIYLLAIVGLLLTSVSFCEMFNKEKYENNIYRIYTSQKNKNGKITLTIDLDNISEEIEDKILEKIKKEENLDILEYIDDIYIKTN